MSSVFKPLYTVYTTGSFTLAPADGEQKIVVTDKAGNTDVYKRQG